MEVGILGLGRMGGNISLRLTRAGHRCVAFDHNSSTVRDVVAKGANGAVSLADLVQKLAPPRTVWVMLPAGEVTEKAIAELAELLDEGDTIIDGGNTFFKDDVRRGRDLATRGIFYLDVGTSGGIWGLERGYCLMIGGNKDVVERLDPIFAALAPGLGDIPRTPGRGARDPRVERGYLHCGPPGSGHFVKMIHNGIEYGMMQAFAEGFDIIRNRASEALPAEERFDLDPADIAEVWRRGSVVSSWLLDLSAAALAKSPELSDFSGEVQDSGEGRWTVQAAVEEAVPAPVLSASLFARFRSRSGNSFGEKLLSAMRFQFGGHVEAPRTPGAER